MSTDVSYQRAYEREKRARELAEQLLDDKSRELYASVVELQSTVETLEQTQAQLVQSEKMASLGQLAAGVAHEINNPVGFSLSNITTLKEYCDAFIELDSAMSEQLPANQLVERYQQLHQSLDMAFITQDMPELLSDTLGGLERVKDIVANLKKLAHKGSDTFSECNINECIEDCLKATENELKYSMDIEKLLADCPPVLGIAAEINQIFINLFVNANQACGNNGKLHIQSSVEGNKVIVKVGDNGCGIPQTNLDKIFDPFYTSKPVGVGTGLGLSISHSIMEKHSGSISVASEVDKGTVFTLVFPCAAQ